MHLLKYIVILFSISLFAQKRVEAQFIEKNPLKADQIVNVNQFDTQYLINDNVFELSKLIGSIEYSNVQLGNITSANAFNPLKINLFYKDFNTVVILDNRLAEITKVDFNSVSPFRMVSHISTGNDNTIWLFNQNTQQIELFDYLTLKSRISTLPINGDILDLKSDYNFCWVMTKDHILLYNYIGSLIEKSPNEGYTQFSISRENIVLLRDNQLFFKSKNSKEIIPLELPELLINQFLVTNETLYIYDGEFLHQYHLKLK